MSRQPLITRATVVAAIGLTAAILGRFGIIVPPVIGDYLVEIGAVAAPLIVAYWARRHVTPTADPRTGDGRPLVPAVTPSDQDAIVPPVLPTVPPSDAT